MDRFLRITLIVTGALAGAAIAFPGLILIGLFLFIVPGIVLGAAPTAFFYVLLFAIGWYLTQRPLGSWAASLVGLGLAAGVAWGVPAALRQVPENAVAAVVAADTRPAEPIPLAGAIALGKSDSGRTLTPYRKGQQQRPLCDDLCLALLFTPGVTTVIPDIEPTPRSEIRPTQYRLTRDAPCTSQPPAIAQGGSGIVQSLAGDVHLAMRIALANGLCLVQEDAGTAADMRLAVEDRRDPKDGVPRWSFDASLTTKRFRVTRGDAVLAQATYANARAISAPLHLDPGNLMATRNSFDWGRSSIVRNVDLQNESLLAFVRRTTTLRYDTQGLDLPTALRSTIDTALADPARPADDEAFRLPEIYIEMLGRTGARADDAARLARILDDPRVAKIGNAGSALKALGVTSVSLREPIVRRILAADRERDAETARSLGRALGNMPPDTFRTLSADERRLVADRERRPSALGLICRLADQGGDATEPLVEILEQAYAPPDNPRKRHTQGGDVAEAAIKGLTNLGPAAGAALPRVEALMRRGTMSDYVRQGDEWTMLLMRLGRPADTLEKPANRNGTQQQYVERRQRELENFTPRRCW